MKKLTTILFVGMLVFAQACNNGSNNKDSVADANDMNAKKDTTDVSNMKKDTMANTMGVSDNAAKFAVAAANGGMMEVELGKLAQEKAINKQVKDFGEMMVKDHTKANDELKSIAAQKNITLPASVSDDSQKKIADLNKKSGKDFDKDYINMMVKDHKDDIDDFEKAAKDSTYPEIQSFAVKTLPTLYKHLGAAKAIQKSNHY
jgi:putative membrane protein